MAGWSFEYADYKTSSLSESILRFLNSFVIYSYFKIIFCFCLRKEFYSSQLDLLWQDVHQTTTGIRALVPYQQFPKCTRSHSTQCLGISSHKHDEKPSTDNDMYSKLTVTVENDRKCWKQCVGWMLSYSTNELENHFAILYWLLVNLPPSDFHEYRFSILPRVRLVLIKKKHFHEYGSTSSNIHSLLLMTS